MKIGFLRRSGIPLSIFHFFQKILKIQIREICNSLSPDASPIRSHTRLAVRSSPHRNSRPWLPLSSVNCPARRVFCKFLLPRPLPTGHWLFWSSRSKSNSWDPRRTSSEPSWLASKRSLRLVTSPKTPSSDFFSPLSLSCGETLRLFESVFFFFEKNFEKNQIIQNLKKKYKLKS